jgi:predicted DCC family thiol-disulfide oxidoreductase YuxK
MHLVLPDGAVLVGERSVPEILRRLRRYRWCASLFDLPGTTVLSRVFYRWFARRRHRAAGFFFPAPKGRDRETH